MSKFVKRENNFYKRVNVGLTVSIPDLSVWKLLAYLITSKMRSRRKNTDDLLKTRCDYRFIKRRGLLLAAG